MKRCSILWVSLICMYAWHHEYLCMPARTTDGWLTNTKQLTGYALCMVCGG